MNDDEQKINHIKRKGDGRLPIVNNFDKKKNKSPEVQEIKKQPVLKKNEPFIKKNEKSQLQYDINEYKPFDW